MWGKRQRYTKKGGGKGENEKETLNKLLAIEPVKKEMRAPLLFRGDSGRSNLRRQPLTTFRKGRGPTPSTAAYSGTA